MSNLTADIQASILKVKNYVDALTIKSSCNIPKEVVSDEHKFFSWDNEKRTPSVKPYLFDWSYYYGVVMEGLYDTYEARPDKGAEYKKYVLEYLNAMLVADENGVHHLSRNLAGYVDHHGADCYKTAALVMKAFDENPAYAEVMAELYRDLTDPKHVNSKGDIVVEKYTEDALGNNYWHCWAGGQPPKYKVWLDGIYMLHPVIALYAAKIGDTKQLAIIKERLIWVADVMLAPNGMYYHACNSREDVCAYHWTRAMGWYAMAMVDVMEVLPECYIEERKAALKLFADGMLKYQDESGLWHTLVDDPTSYVEASATCGFAYGILRAVDLGIVDKSCANSAMKALAPILKCVSEEGKVEQVSYGTPMGRESKDFYKQIPLIPMPYGQALAILFFMEALKLCK